MRSQFDSHIRTLASEVRQHLHDIEQKQELFARKATVEIELDAIIDSVMRQSSALDEIASDVRKVRFKFESGKIFNLQKAGLLTDKVLWSIFGKIQSSFSFQNFAGRKILDLKLEGVAALALSEPFDTLDPLLSVMINVARSNLEQGEELAILQLIVNLYPHGSNAVKRHQHQCRLCASLGYDRDFIVEDSESGQSKVMTMRCGDMLPLNMEYHEVPEARDAGPRASVCLFYGSAREYNRRSISVNPSITNSYWWTHPKEKSWKV